MVAAMHRLHRASWYVVCDDDSFVFVERLRRFLSTMTDDKPLLVGDGTARAHLCGDQLCNLTRFETEHGHRPAISHHAGGPAYALNAAGMRLVAKGLRERMCFDAPFSDTAVGACARAMGVQLLRLPGGFVVNNYNIRATINEATLSWRGQLVAYHRLPERQALCWARYGECDARCNCPCKCGESQCTTMTPLTPVQKSSMAKLSKSRQQEIHRNRTIVWQCDERGQFDCSTKDQTWVPGNTRRVPSTAAAVTTTFC
jgi:hypothetical protein